jgi:hypothetical protein
VRNIALACRRDPSVLSRIPSALILHLGAGTVASGEKRTEVGHGRSVARQRGRDAGRATVGAPLSRLRDERRPRRHTALSRRRAGDRAGRTDSLPGPVGGAVSHGCIRVRNDVVGRLAHRAPLGTPVDISVH